MFSLRYPDPSRAPVAPASGERPDSSGKNSWNRGRHLGLHLGSVCRYWVSHCEQVYEGGIGVCGQLDDFPAGNVPGDLETGIGIEFFLLAAGIWSLGKVVLKKERAQGSDSVSPFSDSRISGRNCMVEKKWKGNFTVEAAILASALLFIVYGIIMALFYYHDKNILTGTTYETAVIAGTNSGDSRKKTETGVPFLGRRSQTIMERKDFRKDDPVPESRGRDKMSQGVCVDFSTSIEEKTENYSVGKGGAYRAGGPDPEHPETKGCSDTRKLKIGYRRDLNTSYFIIESDRFYQADYQMKMLTNNQIPGLLLVKGRGVNGRSRYEYEIQGKHSLEFLTQKGPVTYEMIIAIIEDLLAVMEEMRDYLLSPNQLLLDPRSIFMEGGRYYFCYYPSNVKGISESFHELAEFFVRETDYQDRSGIYISYALHKMTIQENYQICQVIEEILAHQKEGSNLEDQDEGEYQEEYYEYGEEDEQEESEEDSCENHYDDWGLEDRPIGDVIREKVGGWGLIKNLFSHGFKGTKEKLMNGQRNVEYRKKY